MGATSRFWLGVGRANAGVQYQSNAGIEFVPVRRAPFFFLFFLVLLTLTLTFFLSFLVFPLIAGAAAGSAFWFNRCCCRADAGAGSAFCFAGAGAGAVLVQGLALDRRFVLRHARGDIRSCQG